MSTELKSIEKKSDYLLLTFKDDTQEQYKTVIITAPFQQAYNLTKQFSENYFSKFNFSMQPNLTVMVAFNKSLKLDLSAISFENDDVLGFAANENTKKKNLINKNLELWTIQSSLKYAIKNIKEYRNNKQALIEETLKNFSTTLKINISKDQIHYSDIHGWLYAYNLNTAAPNCYYLKAADGSDVKSPVNHDHLAPWVSLSELERSVDMTCFTEACLCKKISPSSAPIALPIQLF